jgi:hypothetical protein
MPPACPPHTHARTHAPSFKTLLRAEQAPGRVFAAAGLAGTFSWVLLYPLEVVRSRMTLAAAGSASAGGIRACVARMLAAEGPVAFYRGLGASVAAIAPEAAITYGLHDLLKRSYRRSTHAEPGVLASLACGVVAAWSGQLVAFPLETVSRRMQLGHAAAAAAAAASAAAGGAAPQAAAAAAGAARTAAGAGAGGSPGVLQVLHGVMQEGGVAALYRCGGGGGGGGGRRRPAAH